MKTNKSILFTLFVIILLTACSMPVRAQPTPAIDQALVSTIAAMTLQVTPTSTPPPAKPAATQTNTPAPTPTVTITPTYEPPILQFTGNTNCRKGPGTEFEVVVVILSGKQMQPLGVSQDGNFYLIKNPDGGDCWVAKDFAQPSGSVAALPTVIAPPTPSPVPPNAPVWSNYTYTCDFAANGNNMTMNLAWTDRSNNEDGFTVYRDEQVVITLAPDTATYTDVAFVSSAKSLSYRVEAFSKAGRASSSIIKASCQ